MCLSGTSQMGDSPSKCRYLTRRRVSPLATGAPKTQSPSSVFDQPYCTICTVTTVATGHATHVLNQTLNSAHGSAASVFSTVLYAWARRASRLPTLSSMRHPPTHPPNSRRVLPGASTRRPPVPLGSIHPPIHHRFVALSSLLLAVPSISYPLLTFPSSSFRPPSTFLLSASPFSLLV